MVFALNLRMLEGNRVKRTIIILPAIILSVRYPHFYIILKNYPLASIRPSSVNGPGFSKFFNAASVFLILRADNLAAAFSNQHSRIILARTLSGYNRKIIYSFNREGLNSMFSRIFLCRHFPL